MSRFITTDRQATALAEAHDLRSRADAIGIPAKWYNRCPHLKAAREMVEQVEAAMTPAAVLTRYAVEYYPMSSHDLQTAIIDAATEQTAIDILWNDEGQKYCPAQIMRVYQTPAPLMVEVMQAQLEQVLSDLDGPVSKETADELMLQAVDLQAAIERENGAMNNPCAMDWLETPAAADDPAGYARAGY